AGLQRRLHVRELVAAPAALVVLQVLEDVERLAGELLPGQSLLAVAHDAVPVFSRPDPAAIRSASIYQLRPASRPRIRIRRISWPAPARPTRSGPARAAWPSARRGSSSRARGWRP